MKAKIKISNRVDLKTLDVSIFRNYCQFLLEEKNGLKGSVMSLDLQEMNKMGYTFEELVLSPDRLRSDLYGKLLQPRE